MPITLNGTTGITTPSIDASAGNSALTTLSVGGNNISSVNSMGFRNRIINGDMRIDQRNAGASVSADNSFPVDRFKVSISGSATATSQRSTVAPSGFTNSLVYTIGTGAAQGASGVYRLFQVIEGFNTADLAWGTSSAQSVTLSFKVRSSVTGTFAGGLNESNGGTASYVFTYTISSANTWTDVSVTVPGPTIGTWQTGSSGSIIVVFDLGSGTNFEQAAGSWASSSNRFRSSGAVVLSATSGATFYITGVQLEAGSIATPFERRDYGRELMMCQRYYEKSYNIGTAPGAASAAGPVYSGSISDSANKVAIPLIFSVKKRAAPTMAYWSDSGVSGSWLYLRNGVGSTLGTVDAGGVLGESQSLAYVNVGAAWTVAMAYGHWTASAEL